MCPADRAVDELAYLRMFREVSAPEVRSRTARSRGAWVHCHSMRCADPRKWMTTSLRVKKAAPRERAVSRVVWEFWRSALTVPTYMNLQVLAARSKSESRLRGVLGHSQRLSAYPMCVHWQSLHVRRNFCYLNEKLFGNGKEVITARFEPATVRFTARRATSPKWRSMRAGRSVHAFLLSPALLLSCSFLAFSLTLVEYDGYWEDILAKFAKRKRRMN